MAWFPIPDKPDWEYSTDPNLDKKPIDHYDYDNDAVHDQGKKKTFAGEKFVLARQMFNQHPGYGEIYVKDPAIKALFATSTAIVYDPQDLTTMYQDTLGTLPAYRPGTGLVDPPVGLMLDKSKGLVLGPELVTNGDFSAGATGWFAASTGGAAAVVDGSLEITPTVVGAIQGFGTSITCSVGAWYGMSVNLKSSVNNQRYLHASTSTNPNMAVFAALNTAFLIGENTYYFKATQTTHYIFTSVYTTGDKITIDDVSVREIKGYHAYQSTTTARPTLSGRYNLLAATETLNTQSVTTVATNYTLRLEGTGTVTLSGTATGTYSAGTRTITCTAGTLTLTVAGSVTRADLRVKRDGSSLPAYQSVTNANTYDTAGFPLFLKRDKVDDVLTCVAPAITGSQGMGSTGGAVLGPVIIPAGTYTPLSESAITGIPEITRYVAIDGTLTASEHAVVERYLSVPSSGVFADEPVFSFGLTSVASFSFTLRTKADTAPVLIDWGDGTQSTHAGTTDQTASHIYAVSGTYVVKVYGADESVLTKFSTNDSGMSGALVMPAGMTYFSGGAGSNTLTGTLSLPSGMTYFYGGAGSNTLSGTLSLPAGMTYFACAGSNTLSGALSLPAGMTNFFCAGSNTLSGTLSLPSSMTSFFCAGSNTLSGTLSLPSGMTNFHCSGFNTLSGYTLSTKASNQWQFYLAGLNTMSATDVDNILIDYAAAGGTWGGAKDVTIQGNAANRTSASDAAYASLATKLTILDVD